MISTSSKCSLFSLVSHIFTQCDNVPLGIAAKKGHDSVTESVEEDPLTEDDYEIGDPTSPGH